MTTEPDRLEALKPCPFAIGDKVRVVVSPEKGWSFDWENLPPHYVTAIAVRFDTRRYDITLSEEWPPAPGGTDGFEIDDLEMVERAAWNSRPIETNSRTGDTGEELLAALKALVASFAESDEDGLTEFAEPMCRARAAIAKAEGRQ